MIISVGGTFLVCLYVSMSINSSKEGFEEGFDYYYVLQWSLQQGIFWIAAHLLIPVTCILTDFLVHACKMFFHADDQMILRENELKLQMGSSVCSMFSNKIAVTTA